MKKLWNFLTDKNFIKIHLNSEEEYTIWQNQCRDFTEVTDVQKSATKILVKK